MGAESSPLSNQKKILLLDVHGEFRKKEKKSVKIVVY